MIVLQKCGIAFPDIAHDIHVQLAGRGYIYIDKASTGEGFCEAPQRQKIDVVRWENAVGVFPQRLDIKAINSECADEDVSARLGQSREGANETYRIVDMFQYLETDN